jgi:DNA-binding transcriptional regulator GbsR (MarR family)
MSSTAGSEQPGASTLIEDFGLRIGRAMGWPPMAGRTSGVLMLSDRPLTLAELQDALDASKGSVSEMTRLLVLNGVVERYKEPGSRQFVFRWRDDAWVGCLQHQVSVNRDLLDLAESAQRQGRHLPSEQRERLRQMRDYYVFMTEQLEALLARYSSSRARTEH